MGCGFAGLDISEAEQDANLGLGGDAGDGDVTENGSGGASSDGGSKGSGGEDTTGSGGTGGLTGSGGNATGGMDGVGGGDVGVGGMAGTGGAGSAWTPLLLHTYEDGMLPAEAIESDKSTLKITEDTVHEGKFALVATQPPMTHGETQMTFALEAGPFAKLYLRAFLYIQPETLTDIVDLFRFQGGEESISLGLTSEGQLFVKMAGASTMHTSTVNRFEPGKWFCYQAEIVVSEIEGSVQLTVGEVVGLSSLVGNTRPGNGITDFTYGILASDSDAGGAQILFDDVAVDDEPIGCEMKPPIATDPIPL
jgi:hypothetical protein